MPLLEGKSAVVTGAAQGIGLAIAEAFAAEGARVVIGDINEEAAAAAAAKLGDQDNVQAARCDVRSADEVQALVNLAADRFGSLDIMVNNAGITRDATLRK